MAQPEKVRGRVVDAHSHIGAMQTWKFYDLKEPVKPTVYEFEGAGDYLRHLDSVGVERGLVWQRGWAGGRLRARRAGHAGDSGVGNG